MAFDGQTPSSSRTISLLSSFLVMLSCINFRAILSSAILEFTSKVLSNLYAATTAGPHGVVSLFEIGLSDAPPRIQMPIAIRSIVSLANSMNSRETASGFGVTESKMQSEKCDFLSC